MYKLLMALVALQAGCTLPKYANVQQDDVSAFGHAYSVALVGASDGQFDVLVMNAGVRWMPDPMQTRQEFMAIGRERAARHCGPREAEMIDAAKPWNDAAGLEMRFRCK